MSVQTRDFVDVAARAREFGLRAPVGIALLPGNFATAASAGEFVFHPATPYVRAAWQSVTLEDEGPDSESGIRYLGLGASSGIRTPVPSPQSLAPSASAKVPLAVFFGDSLLTGPEWTLTVALGMVSRVLAIDPRCASPRDVRLDVAVELPGARGCACIEYQGDAFGIVELVRVVRRIWADKRIGQADIRRALDTRAPSHSSGSRSWQEEGQHLQCRLGEPDPELDLGCPRKASAGKPRSADAESEQDHN
jgi:hypothetical protein